MIYLKTAEEIKIMQKSGRIAALVMREVSKNIQPGVTTMDLDKIAEDLIIKLGAQPSFKRVQGYKYTICATPNYQVVHGIPTNKKLKNGDILGIDLGAHYKGFHSDMAKTFAVGKISNENSLFLSVGEKTLNKAIGEIKIGSHVGNISNLIQENIERSGYSVVREFVGHGVGRELHEDPLVPGVGEKGTGPEIKEGMVLAVEVIYNKGGRQVSILSDGWTVETNDKLDSGLFELTVAATKKGPLVLTSA